MIRKEEWEWGWDAMGGWFLWYAEKKNYKPCFKAASENVCCEERNTLSLNQSINLISKRFCKTKATSVSQWRTQ